MRLKRSTAGAFFAGFLFMGLARGVASAEDFKIKLTRPEKVGNEYKITVTATDSRTITGTANGMAIPPKKDKFTLELTGKMKVEAVEEKFGQPTKLTVTVDKLTKDGDEFYPAGTAITVEKAGKETTFTINGDKVGPEKAEVLSTLFDVAKKDKKFCDDQTMGTDKPQAVGAVWDVNIDNVVKEAADDDITVAPDKAKGQSTLVEVKDLDGVKQMTVKTDLKMDDVKSAGPEGATQDDSQMAVTETEVLPVDEALPATAREQKLEMHMTMSLPNNGGTITVHATETKKGTYQKAG